MTKIMKVALCAIALLSSTVSADALKGKKLYVEEIQKDCGDMREGKFTRTHLQDGWQKIQKDGKLKDEIKRICPKVKEEALTEEKLKHYFDFMMMFAPSC